MCGIFGLLIHPDYQASKHAAKEVLHGLARMSEARGKDSSGMAFLDFGRSEAKVLKGNLRLRELLKDPSTQSKLDASLDAWREQRVPFLAFGHARLVTNGSQLEQVNNQPVVKNGDLLIHNGIITNHEVLWESLHQKREFQIDSEVILATLSEKLLSNAGEVPLSQVFDRMEGTFSTMAFLGSRQEMLLASNNGSLHYIHEPGKFLAFASEAYFLQKIKQKKAWRQFSDTDPEIRAVGPWAGVWIDPERCQIQNLDWHGPIKTSQELKKNWNTKVLEVKGNHPQKAMVLEPEVHFNRNRETALFNLLGNPKEKVRTLRRCTRCILPETFPFIHFDAQGICNYCHGYKPKSRGNRLPELMDMLEPYRKPGRQDCIVPFSGGRDSTFALHMAKRELGLNPIALTYDWGMVTDLARRNISRVCGKLGIENIVVAADIRWKRENIRKNVSAWLRKPHLGMVPLFMAGDKYFFYYTDRLKKQTGIKLNLWGINHLENTDFKVGFAGIPPQFDKEKIYSLSLARQLKLFGFVGSQLIQNPGYLNQSWLDNLGSFATRFLAPKRDEFHFFDFYPWDEAEIDNTLREYHWEKAIDTSTTWRIGDGTAGFYNYIYYTVAGFSEVDTFRSNQIREGMITREKAVELAERENEPRFETIRWYLEMIGLDFTASIKKINAIPKLY